MPHITEFLDAIQYNITNISEFTWNCYGSGTIWIDSNKGTRFDVSANFSNTTKEIREITLHDYKLNNSYRWTDPKFKEARHIESFKKNVDDKVAYGVIKFIDVEVSEDILEKITDAYNDVEYNDKIIIPLDISDKDFLLFAKAAHNLDITFNQFVEKAIKEAVEKGS